MDYVQKMLPWGDIRKLNFTILVFSSGEPVLAANGQYFVGGQEVVNNAKKVLGMFANQCNVRSFSLLKTFLISFLSPRVRTHGGPICITFCLYLCICTLYVWM